MHSFDTKRTDFATVASPIITLSQPTRSILSNEDTQGEAHGLWSSSGGVPGYDQGDAQRPGAECADQLWAPSPHQRHCVGPGARRSGRGKERSQGVLV